MRKRTKAGGVKIILTQRISGLGDVGESVVVRPGYARNYLVPQSRAFFHTKDTEENFKLQKDSYLKIQDEKNKQALLVHDAVEGSILEIVRQASTTGVLFGSVTVKDIVAGIEKKTGQSIQKEDVILGTAIKALGVYDISLNLCKDKKTYLKVYVGRSDLDIKEMILEANKEEYDQEHAGSYSPPSEEEYDEDQEDRDYVNEFNPLETGESGMEMIDADSSDESSEGSSM